MVIQNAKLSGIERPTALAGGTMSSCSGSKPPARPGKTSAELSLMTAFNALEEPAWIMDAECRIQCCNRAAKKLYGDDIVGRHCWEVVHGTKERIAGCPFTGMCQSDRRKSMELPVGAKQFNCTVDPLFDARGKICGAVHVMWDITEQRRGEQALLKDKQLLERRVAERTAELQRTNASLAKSEMQMRRFVESAPVAIAMFDRAMNYLAASRRWLSDYGLQERNIMGRSHYEIFPDLPERIKALHRRGLAGEVLSEEEDCFERADGSVQWLRWEMQPWFANGGGIGGIIIFTEDITGRVLLNRQAAAIGDRLKADVKALTMLHRLGTLSVKDGKLQPVLERIVRAAIAISGADFGNIQLLDPATSELKIMAHDGLPKWWVRFWNGVQKGRGVCGTAMERGERVIVEDVERSPIFIGKPELKIQLKAGVRAVQSTPLISRKGTIVGMFSTHYKTPQRPGDHVLRLLDLLARQAADIIERMQVESALRHSEAREKARAAELETILDTVPVGIAIATDPVGHHIRGNRKNEEMFGLPPGAELSKAGPRPARFRVFRDGRELSVAELPMQQAVRGGNIAGMELEIVCENGRKVAVYTSAAPLLDETGRPRGAVGTFLDITARKRAEEALRGSEARFRNLFESMSNGVAVFEAIDGGRDFVFKDFNAAGERIDQIARGRVIGRRVTEVFPSVKVFGLLDVLRRVWLTGKAQHHPASQYKDDRVAGWRENHIYKLPSGEVVAVYDDVTERVQAESALRQSEERLKKVVEVETVGVMFWDLTTGVMVDANDSFLKMMGYTRHDVEAGRLNWQKLTPPEFMEVSRAEMRKFMTTGRVGPYEKEYLHKDGTRQWLLFAGSALDKNHCVEFCVDISARKQAEQLLQRANRTLAAIRDCHEAILRAETENDLLNDVCRIIVQTGGERMAWVGYAENDARKFVRPVAESGVSKDYLETARITWADRLRGRGPVGAAIRTGQVCITRDTQTDPGFAPWRAAAQQFGYGSVIALPLKSDGECFGALSIYAPRPDAFDKAEQQLLADLAKDLAFGITTLRLRAERARLEDEVLKSAECEQERIGRDLHDGLCQLLTGAKFRSAYLAKIERKKFSAVRREAGALEKILNAAIEQTRDLARGLNPVNPVPDGLVVALQQLADHVASPHAPHCFCRLPRPVKVADHHAAQHLYRIAQEAVQNALKHARAKNISIALTRSDGQIVLTVKDDGVGIPNASRKKGGMGLGNMQTRARLIGGRLEIRRRKHGGTAVTCEWPQKPGRKP